MYSTALAIAVVVVLAISIGVVGRVSGVTDSTLETLRARFIYGVPWGSLVVFGFVLGVYLFVQGGWRDWHGPVTIAFQAWSYFYPTGMATGAFAHSSAGHLTNNLVGTLVLAPIAEYAWSHYPPEDAERSLTDYPLGATLDRQLPLDRWLTTPWLRAVVFFPGAVIGVGIATALFGLGPVIGFSMVVFAFGGFAIVHYPIATIVGLMGTTVVRTIHRALADPVLVAGVTGSPPAPPSWATIAVQGHALGVMLGIVLGLLLTFHRGRRPAAGRVFIAVLLYGIHRSLWAVYWFLGDGQYVLYRGVGVLLVTILALLVVLAASAPTRSAGLSIRPGGMVPRRLTRLIESGNARRYALALLIGATVLIAAPAVVPNLTTVAGDDAVPGDGHVEIDDYTITYEENVRNQLIPVVDVPVLAEQTTVRTSGVIVVSEDRNIWNRVVSRSRLESTGRERVRVGGIGWQERVTVQRSGWEVAGNSSVYHVDLHPPDDDPVRSFEADPSTAEPTVANHTVTLQYEDETLVLSVAHDGDHVDTVPMPAENESVTVGDLRLVVEPVDNRLGLFAEHDGTRVRLAQRERYRGW